MPKQNKVYKEYESQDAVKVGDLVIEGVNYGKISENGFNALKNNTLSSYKPVDDEEAATIKNYRDNYKIEVKTSDGKTAYQFSPDDVGGVEKFQNAQKEREERLFQQFTANSAEEKARKEEIKISAPHLKDYVSEQGLKDYRAYQSYEEELFRDELNKQIDPNGIAAKYGYSAVDFNDEDMEEWAKNNNHTYFDDTSYYGGKSGGKSLSIGFGATEEQRRDGQVLKAIVDNNNKRKRAKTDVGAIGYLDKFADGISFGLLDYAIDKSEVARMKSLGLNPEFYVPQSEVTRVFEKNNPYTSAAAEIAGTVVASMGVGGLVSTGLKTAGWGVGKATIARAATVQGITGALRGGITTASSGGDWGDIVTNALREGITGAAGGAVGGIAEKGITKLLNNSKYATSTLGKLKNLKVTAYGVNAVGGVTDALADYGTDQLFVTVANNVFDAGLQERTGKDLLTDFAVSLALGTAMNIKPNTKAGVEARVEDVVNRYGAEYIKYTEKINGADVDTKVKAGEEFIETTNKFKKELNEQLFPGKAKDVETLHEMLDVAIDSTKTDMERARKSKINASGIKTHRETAANYDVDLAISNIINGRATDRDFDLFVLKNNANRQAFYETTGIKLPEDSRLSNYILNALNNKEKRIRDIYLKHNANSLNQPDSLTLGDENVIIDTRHKYGEMAIPYDDDLIPFRIKKYLSELNKYGDELKTEKPLTFEEISLMSRQSGVEFASITCDGVNYIIRGNKKDTMISEEILLELKRTKGKLNCHSHPYIGDLNPSVEDVEFAKLLDWQDEFYIVAPDKTYSIYTVNGLLEIRNIEKDISEEDIEFYKSLFEE